MTEWVINGSSSRRIPYNPKIGKRQQAQGGRQKAQLRSSPSSLPPCTQGLQMGKFPLRRKRQEWENIHTFPGLDLTTEPGCPAPYSTTPSLPHQPFPLRFFLLNSSRKTPTPRPLTVAQFSTFPPKAPIFHLGKRLITEDQYMRSSESGKELSAFLKKDKRFHSFTTQGRQSVRTK